jgi:uncharacterized membrane protein
VPVAARHYKYSLVLILATFLWLVSGVLLVGLLVSFVEMLAVGRDHAGDYAKFAAVFLGGWMILRVIRFIIARRVTCPLCHGHILQKKKCRMHQDSRKLGPLSHRQSMMLDVATRAKFTCMFCGTPYRLRR